ncbi:MAG TPA: thiamine pyrophosphate-binding protein [Polyangiaceae bacterium]
MRVVDLFAGLVELEKIDCVFTVPGGTALPLLRALSRTAVRVVVGKDEAGAAYAADGYAFASGKPGVVVTIGGPGVTNALTALCCSRAQGNPVVLLSGEVATSSMGRGAVQDGSDLGIDVLAMSRPATALSAAGDAPDKAGFALLEAFRRAMTEQRPVHVSLPLDVQVAQTRVALPASVPDYRCPARATFGVEGVRAAAQYLRSAERPALLVGSGARHASEQVLVLAETLGCPVATTCGAKGVFPEDHPLSVGVFSFGSGPLGRRALVDGVDVLCAVGSRLGEFSSMNFSRELVPTRAFIQIDQDRLRFGRNYEVVPVVGDARAALAALIREIGRVETRRDARFEALKQREPRVVHAALQRSSAVPIRPERLMHELELLLPREAWVVADIGTSCLFVAHYLKLARGQKSYIPMEWSCMAHPLAASIGVRLGSRCPTVCVTGDAAFLSKGLELHAAVEARVSGLVWVVLSNRGHGLVRLGTEKLLGPGHGVEAGDFRTLPNAAEIARAVGAIGRVVERPEDLPEALAAAFRAELPVVLDVRVDPTAEPPMTDRIQGLKNAQADSGSER